MKKTKFLALVLVVALVLTGTAFAWWGDTLTMSQTVKTGELNVFFDDAWTRGGDNTKGEDYYEVPTSGYPGWVEHEGNKSVLDNFIPTVVSCDGDRVYAEVGNMYPGSRAQFEFRVKNDGTIPAVLDRVRTNIHEFPPYIVDNLTLTVGVRDAAGHTVWKSGPAVDLQNVMRDAFLELRLDPGQTASSQIFIYFDKDGALVGDDGEKQQINFYLQFDWTQFNNPEVATPAASPAAIS